MKDHWVIRYDGWICGEWETTWVSKKETTR